MKTMVVATRSVLGLIFLVFGLNGFLHFLSMPPPPAHAAAFLGALAKTRYMMPLIMGTQVIAGTLLVVGLWVPFALLLLAPVIVNVVAFHVFLAPGGLPFAIVVSALELALAWHYRATFAPLFQAHRLQIRSTTLVAPEIKAPL